MSESDAAHLVDAVDDLFAKYFTTETDHNIKRLILYSLQRGEQIAKRWRTWPEERPEQHQKAIIIRGFELIGLRQFWSQDGLCNGLCGWDSVKDGLLEARDGDRWLPITLPPPK